MNHTVRLPRRTSAASYSGQFVTRYLAFGILWRRLSLNLYGMELSNPGCRPGYPTIVPPPSLPGRLFHRRPPRSPDTRNAERLYPVFVHQGVAFEAGRDGFWLARWLRARGIEAYVIHPTSIPVSREHRRAKTDRLDIGLLKRAFLGWLRGETRPLQHGRDPDAGRGRRQAAEPRAREPGRRAHPHRQPDEEQRSRALASGASTRNCAKRRNVLRRCAHRRSRPLPPNTLAELQRDMAHLRFIDEQIKQIEEARRNG